MTSGNSFLNDLMTLSNNNKLYPVYYITPLITNNNKSNYE